MGDSKTEENRGKSEWPTLARKYLLFNVNEKMKIIKQKRDNRGVTHFLF